MVHAASTDFKARMDEFAQMMKSRALRPGFTEMLIPGEQEARRVARKSADGVPLEDDVLADLTRAARANSASPRQIVVVGPYTDRVL